MLNPRLVPRSDREIDRALAERPPRQPLAPGADDLAVALGQVIHQARFRAGLTQYRLARSLGVDRSTVSRWEAGLRTPTMPHLRALGELVDRPASALLAEVEQLLLLASASTTRPPEPTTDPPPARVPVPKAATRKPRAPKPEPTPDPIPEPSPEPASSPEPTPEPVPAGGAIWALAGWWRQAGSVTARPWAAAGLPVRWPVSDDGEVASAGD